MRDRLLKSFFLHRLRRFPALGVLALFFLFPSMAFSQQSEALGSYFNGKTITVIVGSAPGGGYDVTARLVARFAGKHLPGSPSFVVQNLPGGGQLRGLRAAMKAKPDGFTVGMLHPRFVVRQLVGIDVPDLDLKTVKVLGTPSGVRRPRVWCTRKSLATTWKEVLKLGRPVIVGANEAGGLAGTLGPEFVEAIGGPVKMVFGYGGASEAMAAFDRGELDSVQYCTEEYVPRLFPEWIAKKDAGAYLLVGEQAFPGLGRPTGSLDAALCRGRCGRDSGTAEGAGSGDGIWAHGPPFRCASWRERPHLPRVEGCV
jgi:hypothetical protein